MQITLIMRIMPEKSILFQLLPRLLNNYQKPKSYRLCFSDTFLRLNYSTSVNGMNFCRKQHGTYKNTFKKLKFDMNKDIVSMLGEIFETNDKKFERALLHQKHLEKCSEEHLRDMALYLRGLNFTAEHITLSPWILSLTKKNIESKTPLIQQQYLFENLLDGLGFTILNSELLDFYKTKFEKEKDKFDPFRNRIYYIGSRLNISVEFLALKIVQCWEVLHVKKESLDSIIDVLLEFNYKPMDILTDLRVLRHNSDTARERLTKYLEVENSLPKLWVLRSSQFYFDRTYIRAKKYGKYFSDDSVEVLKECLNMDEENSLKFIDRGFLRVIQPRVLRYKISKFKEIGLSDEDFKRFPSIFTKCESVIEKRMNILKENGLFETKKGALLYSDKNFNIIMERNIQIEKRKRKLK